MTERRRQRAEKALALYRAGRTADEIAREIGMSPITLRGLRSAEAVREHKVALAARKRRRTIKRVLYPYLLDLPIIHIMRDARVGHSKLRAIIAIFDSAAAQYLDGVKMVAIQADTGLSRSTVLQLASKRARGTRPRPRPRPRLNSPVAQAKVERRLRQKQKIEAIWAKVIARYEAGDRVKDILAQEAVARTTLYRRLDASGVERVHPQRQTALGGIP